MIKDWLPVAGAALVWAIWGSYKQKNPDAKIAPDMPTFRAIKKYFKKK